RGQGGAVWCFLVVAGVAAWHRVPLHPYHRTLLVSFGLYLSTYTLLLSWVGARAASRPAYLAAWGGQPAAGPAFLPEGGVREAREPLAFAATAGVWAWAAWRAPRRAPSAEA